MKDRPALGQFSWWRPLRAHLNSLTPPIYVAYSGGVDSTALLAIAINAMGADKLTAIHVNHAISPNAQSWQDHCAGVANKLGCRFEAFKVDVSASGLGLEAAARKARYHVFEQVLQEGGSLLMGHHADDQLETQLLNMMRGSGPVGMVGIPSKRIFSKGEIVRPLLHLTRSELSVVVKSMDLPWVDDESNQTTKFDRNYLRHNVTPPLCERFSQWPSAVVAMSHAMSDASSILSEVASQDVDLSQNFVELASLSTISDARRRNVIMHWFYEHTGMRLSRNGLQHIDRQLFASSIDASPEYLQSGWRVCRQRGRLWLLPVENDQSQWCADWDISTPLSTPYGVLSCEQILGGWQLPTRLQVTFRRGGERMSPLGRGCSKSLKSLFKELNIPEWQRAQLPLISSDSHILALADLVYSQLCQPKGNEMGVQLIWQPN